MDYPIQTIKVGVGLRVDFFFFFLLGQLYSLENRVIIHPCSTLLLRLV